MGVALVLTKVAFIIFASLFISVDGQIRTTTGMFSQLNYIGVVLKHQPRHYTILEVRVHPNSDDITNTIQQDSIVYYSYNIDEQFYIHSRLGRVAVNMIDLIEGDYDFIVYANYTTGAGVMEIVSATVNIRVAPEYIFVGTEPEGGYLSYIDSSEPLGAHVITIRANYTRLTDTVFSYVLAPDTNTTNSRVSLSPDGAITRTSYNMAGIQQFNVLCTATSQSSGVVVETLEVNVTVVLYNPSDLQVEVSLSDDLILWSQPNIATGNTYSRYLLLQQFAISIVVYNGDVNNADGPSTNVVNSQTYSFQHQPVIPRTTLVVNVTTVSGVDTARTISVSSFNNFSIPGDVLQAVTDITVRRGDINGELSVTWQLLSLNVTGYTVRLSYDEQNQRGNERSTPVQHVQNTSPFDNSFLFTSLPGNTTYTIIIVVTHLNGQRVLSTPVQYNLPGYAPSISPIITIARYLPTIRLVVEWRRVFFSNGDVQSYIVEFTSNTNNTMTINTSDIMYQSNGLSLFSGYGYVDAVVRAVNQFGSGPASSPERIFLSGAVTNLTVTNVTDRSACFVWYPAASTIPSGYTVRVNGDPVLQNVIPTLPPQMYCQLSIRSGTPGYVVIESVYQSSITIESSRVEFHTVNPIFNFTATSITSSSAELEWSLPAAITTTTPFLIVMEYDIELTYVDLTVRNPIMITSRRPLASPGSQTFQRYMLLQPGIEYTAIVIGIFNGGQETRSPPRTFTTRVDSPTNRPASLVLISYNTTTQLAVFQWSSVYYSNGPITGYKLYIGDADPYQLQGASNNTAEVNIGNNLSLSVRVAVVNSAGEGPQIVRNIIIDVAPRAYYYMINNTAIRLFWDPPSFFITDITGYNIISSTTVNTNTLDANSYIFSGLSFNTLYTFQVAAVYPSRMEESNLISVQTLGPVCSPPCQNSGICVNDHVCMCPAGFTGDQCETAYCDPPCPYGGSCDIDTITCNCSTVTIGGNDVCYGGRINTSCQCDCYDGLFSGENCAEPLRYEPTLLASPTNNGQEINITLVPPEPVASDTTILDYRLRITAGGDSVQVFNILSNIITISLPFNNNSFNLQVQTRFTIDEHHNNDVFTIDGEPVRLSINNCGSKMYGGFNGSECQSCPMNTGSNGGFTIDSCQCLPGYTVTPDGTCNACEEGTFKPNIGNEPCQTCRNGMTSSEGDVGCTCAMGYEQLGIMICAPCQLGYYKDTVGDTSCTQCPADSTSRVGASISLNDCQCLRSIGNVEDGCYAFINKPSVTMPDNSQTSSTWVVISWTPLTIVRDTMGNSNPVAGFYIFYNPVSVKRVAVSGSINITGNASSANLTNLEEGTQYDVTVSAYIEGFQLGPPTNLIINTFPLGNNVTTGLVSSTFLIIIESTEIFQPTISMSLTSTSAPISTTATAESTEMFQPSISMSSTITSAPISTTFTATPTTNGTIGNIGGNDNTTTIIIIAAVAGGAAIALLLLITICIVCLVCKRRRSKGKATISMSTKKMMEKHENTIQNPGFRKITSDMVVTNPSFIENKDHEKLQGKHDDKEQSPVAENVYTNVQIQSHNRYEEHRARYLEMSANTITAAAKTPETSEPKRMATPDDYDNEALYEEMSAHYYVVDEKTPLKSKEMARHRVKILEQLGKGEFGRVMKGLASGIISGEKDTTVAVKMLKEGASEEDKKNFLGEAHMLAQFNHPNVLALLGVVTVEEPVLVVIPFMKNGDLRAFLSKNQEIQISNGDKLDIAVQIASGMEYLAARFFIHRDLAARNILIDEKLHAKISDFGLSRILAKEDTYYKLSNVAKLPVKWMALESIEYRKFSTFSDVWSYGVVLWEIFSLGKIPFKGVPNSSLPTYLRNGKRLEQPNHCSDEIYSIMQQCWLLRKERRPTFGELKKDLTELLAKEGRIVSSDIDMYSLYV